MSKYKFLSFIVIMLLAVGFSSCSKDDDNGPDPNAPKKRITQVATKQYGRTEIAKFEYSGEKLSKITVTRTGESKPFITQFEYGANEVKLHYTNKWFYGDSESYTQTFTLNSDGYIASYKYGTYSDTYTYSNGYLLSIDIGEPKGTDEAFAYDKSWNMIQNNEFQKITYTDTSNIGGLYLCYDQDQQVVLPILYSKLVGKPSKHLPKTAQFYADYEGLYTNHFEYVLDGDGYVSVINGTATVKPDGGKEVREPSFDWTETYTYEVIE